MAIEVSDGDTMFGRKTPPPTGLQHVEGNARRFADLSRSGAKRKRPPGRSVETLWPFGRSLYLRIPGRPPNAFWDWIDLSGGRSRLCLAPSRLRSRVHTVPVLAGDNTRYVNNITRVHRSLTSNLL